jgi:DNA repair exonuclease SbcCD nuclease subunit
MIRFIHTADWQIGMKASGVGSASQAVRNARMDAIKRIVEIANEQHAQLMLVTGDVFEDNAVDRLLVRRVGEMLKGFSGPVYIIPGNHDPLSPGSVWEHSVWDEVSNVNVIHSNEPIELDDCILYPCPLKEKYSSRNPTSWIDANKDKKITLGLAHGNVEGLPDPEPDFPIPKNAAQLTGLDYLGIGHWHSFAPYFDDSGACRMAYSGTHESTKFGERASGNVLLIKIENRGAEPEVESLRTGQLTWQTLEVTLDHEGALEKVISEVNGIEDPEKTLIRVRLGGILYSTDRPLLRSLEEVLTTRFLFGSLDSAQLIPAPEDDTWIETLPAGPIRETANELRELAINGRDDAGKAVATQALIQLFELQEKAMS